MSLYFSSTINVKAESKPLLPQDGATALFLAAQGGYLDVIRLLLSSGAKVNQPRQVMSFGAEGREWQGSKGLGQPSPWTEKLTLTKMPPAL